MKYLKIGLPENSSRKFQGGQNPGNSRELVGVMGSTCGVGCAVVYIPAAVETCDIESHDDTAV